MKRKKDTTDYIMSVSAVVVDAMFIFGAFILSVWVRFDSGLLNVAIEPPADFYLQYARFGVLSTIVYLFVFKTLLMYQRPQTGVFVVKIPRYVRGVLLGTLFAAVLAFAFQNNMHISRLVIGLSSFIILFVLILEKYVIYRIEWNISRHSKDVSNVVILGTDNMAVKIQYTLKKEPMLRLNVVGFLKTSGLDISKTISEELFLGGMDDLDDIIEKYNIKRIILADTSYGHDNIVELVNKCEKNLIVFNMLPDLFGLMSSPMDVHTLNDIPLLGLKDLPLDSIVNRFLKRCEDIFCSFFGLILTAPIMLVFAIIIKRTSPGPVFYRQERCGIEGKVFTLYKLRTMNYQAAEEEKPTFTKANDDRVTKSGAFMRKNNIDELPQLWNVLRGNMSLVGPRPERPYFVEQFKGSINRYMRRHIYKPGLTGWAQINGLRGDTSIDERLKYDLYYLENWSLALDFKIILKSFYAVENAY
jgi:exopolysaccharide biosynthesis polyprenyl glycosylphosphotransferase